MLLLLSMCHFTLIAAQLVMTEHPRLSSSSFGCLEHLLRHLLFAATTSWPSLSRHQLTNLFIVWISNAHSKTRRLTGRRWRCFLPPWCGDAVGSAPDAASASAVFRENLSTVSSGIQLGKRLNGAGRDCTVPWVNAVNYLLCALWPCGLTESVWNGAVMTGWGDQDMHMHTQTPEAQRWRIEWEISQIRKKKKSSPQFSPLVSAPRRIVRSPGDAPCQSAPAPSPTARYAPFLFSP